MTDTDYARLNVDLGPRSYDILIGPGLLKDAGTHMKDLLEQPRVVIISDDNVAPLYASTLTASLDAHGIRHDTIVLPAGEQTKSFAQLEALTGRLLDLKAERKTTLIALGGGVIGDLVGFAAAITLRGMPFIQIPTTLLSQVDSSVGGKTGINAPQGKNLVGAFHQPRLVLADIDTLNTLPKRQLLSGYAEVLKYGVINRLDFFVWLENNGQSLINGDVDARRHAVYTSCAAKAAIVAEDERETGARALLNLGHTFGHALESETGYGDTLQHGEAVAIGMVMALDTSVRMGLCLVADRDRLVEHLASLGMPVGLNDIAQASWTSARLIAHMGQDKKMENGKLNFILARGIGQSFITNEVPADMVTETLDRALDLAVGAA